MAEGTRRARRHRDRRRHRLAADAWRVDLADRRTEREYLSRLRSELETARAAIAANRDRVSQSVAAIDNLLPLEPWSEVPESPFVDLTLRAANYTFNEAGIVYDLTYREMSATGSLNLIRDPGLRVRLTNYYRLAYRTAHVNREVSRAYAERVGSITLPSQRDRRRVSR